MGLIKNLIKGLEKTRTDISAKLAEIVKSFRQIDDEFFDELEFILVSADLGPKVTSEILAHLRAEAKKNRLRDTDELIVVLKNKLKDILSGKDQQDYFKKTDKKRVILIVGVNGTGKTTSAGKLAYLFSEAGNRTLIAAADTFRAAAAEQLQIWADRSGSKMIRQAEGADPSAVIYDAISMMQSSGYDVLICDTAGRLHNKKNLMVELGKIYSTVRKQAGDAEITTLLVIDASTGQNGVNQAKLFKEAAAVDGIILTKIDGTAKGGIIFPIIYETGIPVLFIGIGEKIDDFGTFDPDTFVDAIFDK